VAEIVLSAQHLTKSFGKRVAVADVSFEIFAGEVYGFLGPNGAGKTTTIRMLVSHVGCIVEAPDLYKYLTGRENLLHFSRMLPDGAAARIPDLARLVSLDERLDDRVSTYSLGMRQRLGIAQALLGNPDVLILDEPANGLDPAGIREIRRLVRTLAEERGIAVFVSSHLLAEVELMCDRVAIIHRGRTLATGPVRELLDRPRGRYRFSTRPADVAARVLAAFAATGAPNVEDDRVVTLDLASESVPDAVRALAGAGVDIYSVERPPSSLEEVFLEVTGGETV